MNGQSNSPSPSVSLTHLDPHWVEHGYGTRFLGFQNLMQLRIRDILLVSSLYDLYVFEEDGRLYELIRNEYQLLNLSHAPELTRVSSAREALTLMNESRRFDLVITTMHIEDMSVTQFARSVRESNPGIPIVLIANNNRELAELLLHGGQTLFERIFIWQGDYRLLIAVIKHLEDRMNLEHDTRTVGVQSIILIEDNIRYYSSFLPIIYLEILKHSQRLISEGINLSHKYLRMRARPKILLCTAYEEAWNYFLSYQEYVLGVISDIDFARDGNQDPAAGIAFARNVKALQSDIPILLQSNLPENEEAVHAAGAEFLLKDSPTLMDDLRRFMTENFSFGDFVFRLPNGAEVGRAGDLQSLEEQLARVPEESIRYHAERNHFSNWLKARTEFWLAHQLRPRKVSDFANLEAMRGDLIQSLRHYRKIRQRGIITDFKKDTFDIRSSFARIGGGSLGGKARGLGFINILINNYNVQDRYNGIHIFVPPAVVLGTDVFDQFIAENNLGNFALNATDDREIIRAFIEAERFPEEAIGELAAYLDLVREPLAVRSSSLLEDSQYHPFAGVYETYMIPNNQPDPFSRLSELIKAVKRVYASTFFRSAKEYIKVTSYRLEEEKMAVIVQKMIGAAHGNRFYPDISAVAKSHNFYPAKPQKAADGIVSAALGLGKTVVDGGMTVRFCPKYPRSLMQFSSVKESLRNNQREFFALDLAADPESVFEKSDLFLQRWGLDTAEKDGTLRFVASTYQPENDRIVDGIARAGARLVTFAPVLKDEILPFAEICELLLDMGCWSMGTQIEIELAVNLSVEKGKPVEFGLLQMRPLVIHHESEELDMTVADPARLLCRSGHVLGHGIIEDIADVVFIDPSRFDRAASAETAAEVAYFNAHLRAEGLPYLLVGPGRWGSLDPWLGVPVTWGNIAGARVIVEAGMKDIDTEPSQGSHFFQNLTSFQVGYFSVYGGNQGNFIDWEWLNSLPVREQRQSVRWVRSPAPLIVRMDGRRGIGIILKA